MSGIKGVFKDGWHPKGKDGGKESWRGDFKGINQVVRLVLIYLFTLFIIITILLLNTILFS